MDLINILQIWYNKHCNSDWEHSFGIKICTLDNPGWSVIIDLEDTEYEKTPFNNINIERNEKDWIDCKVENKQFIGVGGVNNLNEILETFKKYFC